MISEKELKELIRIKSDIEKFSTISDDGKNLLTRIPKTIEEHLDLKKGFKIKWSVNSKKKIKIEIVK